MADILNQAKKTTPFAKRHIGPNEQECSSMLEKLNYPSVDSLIDTAVPPSIRDKNRLDLPEEIGEAEALSELAKIMDKNEVFKSYIGMGYHDCITPPAIQRHILENPGWYTQYTPYQAEISQGRLEVLFNYQTMICELTGLEISNASLLDEGTACGEAMNMCFSLKKRKNSNIFYVADNCHPQTIAFIKTKAAPLGIEVRVTKTNEISFDEKPFGILLQYPATDGTIEDYGDLIKNAHDNTSFVVMACDILSLLLLKSPGELGADVAVGTTQRFGTPLGFGGPHSGFFATKDAYKRKLPGRLVGVSKDTQGNSAFRLSLATREQHIRRDKATSNICTAQALIAIMSTMYATYHGPKGLKEIASRIHALTSILYEGLTKLEHHISNSHMFDTLTVKLGGDLKADTVLDKAIKERVNLRKIDDKTVSISLDETTNLNDLNVLLGIFTKEGQKTPEIETISDKAVERIPEELKRQSKVLQQEAFNTHHSETLLLRYIKKLESRDLSLTKSMIPLGSCTMKLNAAAELFPITWEKVNKIHPFVPKDQTEGYQKLFKDLGSWLAEISGFDAVSLQPNSGAQGEYAGLLTIRQYLLNKGEKDRNICFIPSSAHGTNPASAAFAGMKIVEIKCDSEGNIDIEDLKEKTLKHQKSLAALMITYPSTFGIFEDRVNEMCDIIHECGGQVYLDGANFQAQISLMRPGKFGADVCHFNLHKTFAMPHGGGGPGVGPIAVKKHLADFLPNHPVIKTGGDKSGGPVAAAPWGSASILPITWMYIRMMGGEGLGLATKVAILNANYIATKLEDYYPVVYRGNKGLVAHECIIDLKEIKKSCGVTEIDIAKRLMDYGFHAPTVSFPVPSSMMIEPTESESLCELDRFCDAMISIRNEIKEIEEERVSKEDNLLKNAPHTMDSLSSETWDHPYSREQAVFPDSKIKENKFWPYVSRIDEAYGDRNLVCSMCH